MKKPSRNEAGLDRREFGRVALAGALGGNALFSLTGAAEDKSQILESKMKIAAQMSASLSDEEIRFVRQLGIDHVVIWTGGTNATYDSFVRLRKKAETAGLRIWNIGNVDVHNMEEVTLNLPGRDEKIAQYIQYLRDIGRVGGIHYTTYAHMGNGIWSTKPETTRGGARARAFDLSKATQGRWNGKVFRMPLTHGRTYTEQEIWDNYAYFIKKVAPVAEEKGIRIGIHPDDPPALELGGVPRCIFSSFDGYRRALDIANSPNVGMCLCVGCWLEGGELMGKDIIETIRYFGERKKIFKVHFRNVSAPLPHFVETFLDNGYMNMYEVMRALREVDFDGVIITDHLPYMNKPATAFAHAAGYMRALIERANAEFGVSRHVRRSASTKAVTSKMSPAGVDGVPV